MKDDSVVVLCKSQTPKPKSLQPNFSGTKVRIVGVPGDLSTLWEWSNS